MENLIPKIQKNKKFLINKYKREAKDAYRVISGQKLQSVITPKQSPFLINFTNGVLNLLKIKHPDKANTEFNKALGFIKTLHFPDKFKEISGKQRIYYYRKLTGKYTEKINRVVVKPIKSKKHSYINTSHLIGRKQRIKKVLSEGLATPSSPIGVGARLPTSKAQLNFITSVVNKQLKKKQ